jgi:hypothetical protein
MIDVMLKVVAVMVAVSSVAGAAAFMILFADEPMNVISAIGQFWLVSVVALPVLAITKDVASRLC